MQEQFSSGEVILIDKDLQWTSYDVVRKVKRLTGAKRVGHAGTLDPLATGLLVVCTEKMTKKIQEIQDAEKEYTGTIFIGATTPSFDRETETDREYETGHITPDLLQHVFSTFTGELEQVPPLHSAIKVNGQRAYKIARRGEHAELKSRKVFIRELEITRIELPEVDFRTVCSKGTYIRSLARDLGIALGAGAYLRALRRTRIGTYRIEEALTIGGLGERMEFLSKNQITDNQ